VAAHDAAIRAVERVRVSTTASGFDGSSIRGWQGISESDMLLMPDASSAILDPFTEASTLSLICEIADPITREPYAKDPRRLAKRARSTCSRPGIADTAFMGPGVRVLRLRRGLLRAWPQPLRITPSIRRGPLELRQAGARLHRAREGGLLPTSRTDTLTISDADGADAGTPPSRARCSEPRLAGVPVALARIDGVMRAVGAKLVGDLVEDEELALRPHEGPCRRSRS